MARYTTAYSGFVARVAEVELLQREASRHEVAEPFTYRHQINAFCRSAIVLLSAHLEAYIKDLGEVALIRLHSSAVPRKDLHSRLFYHISKDRLDEIQETSDPDKIAAKVFDFIEKDGPYWERTGAFPSPIPSDRFNKGFSNPALDKVRAYFGRFGYSDYKIDLARKLKGDYQAISNMVNHLVDMRNKIAHGDPTATETPADLDKMRKMIRDYCRTTDTVFADWCKDNLCVVR